MRVTDEMVERATRARVHTLAMAREKAERIVLEAALADVPDPEDVRTEIMEGLAYGRSVERQMLDARIAELEAKLEKGERDAPLLGATYLLSTAGLHGGRFLFSARERARVAAQKAWEEWPVAAPTEDRWGYTINRALEALTDGGAP